MALQGLCAAASIYSPYHCHVKFSVPAYFTDKLPFKPSNANGCLKSYTSNKKNFPRIQSELSPNSASNTCSNSLNKYEAERLSQDARARQAMMTQSQIEEENDDSKAWKWEIRKRIWGLMERENIAQFPRPVHHRIPNFVGAASAAQKLSSLQAFCSAQCVKVNPDTPQKQVRSLTLSGGKNLLTPQPRLRTGFFSILDVTMFPLGAIHEACTSAGVAKYGKPIGLDAKLKVDLVVVGSVAVDPCTGARLGKGEGFAELEYGMLRYMGAIDDSTLIVTSVHDRQLVDDIPVDKLQIHDVPVDVICTPTQIIYTNTTIPKPKGIYWDKLSPEKLSQIKILRELKKLIEEESGQPLPCGPSEKLPPTAERKPRKQG